MSLFGVKMKKTIILILILLIYSCNEDTKNHIIEYSNDLDPSYEEIDQLIPNVTTPFNDTDLRNNNADIKSNNKNINLYIARINNMNVRLRSEPDLNSSIIKLLNNSRKLSGPLAFNVQ